MADIAVKTKLEVDLSFFKKKKMLIYLFLAVLVLVAECGLSLGLLS